MKTICISLSLFFILNSAIAQIISAVDSPILLHPEQEVYIKNYINRFSNNLLNLKTDNKELLQFIEYVLLLQGVPKEFKNLAVIESSLNNKSISIAGAVGPWQLMPETAKEFGLKVDSTIDERYDIYKSTFAAAKMLKRLYKRYNDWSLVIIAYNCGIGHLDKAIAQTGSMSFNELQYYLPAESRNHVKKFIGTTFVLDKNIVAVAGGDKNSSPIKSDSLSPAQIDLATEYVQAGITLSSISKRLSISIDDLKKWNKDFEALAAKNGFAWLALPFDKMTDFKFYKNEILQAAMQENIMK
ncbi:MAG: transglycosylase SLT domain-containing protein [Chitinophagaceae bacterium]